MRESISAGGSRSRSKHRCAFSLLPLAVTVLVELRLRFTDTPALVTVLVNSADVFLLKRYDVNTKKEQLKTARRAAQY